MKVADEGPSPKGSMKRACCSISNESLFGVGLNGIEACLEEKGSSFAEERSGEVIDQMLLCKVLLDETRGNLPSCVFDSFMVEGEVEVTEEGSASKGAKDIEEAEDTSPQPHRQSGYPGPELYLSLFLSSSSSPKFTASILRSASPALPTGRGELANEEEVGKR